MKYKKSLNKNAIIFIIGVVAILIISAYAATYYMLDKFHIEGWFSMLTNIAISYVAAVFFYIFQVYWPQKKKEAIALISIRSSLCELQKKLIITALLMEKYFTIEDKHLMIKWNAGNNEEILYFQYKYANKSSDAAATPGSYSKADFLSAKKGFKMDIDKIKQSVYAPYYSDALLEILSDLEQTNLYDNLAVYMMFCGSEMGFNDSSVEHDTRIARELADRIGYFTGNKCEILLVEADATSKAIAKAMKNPSTFRSVDQLNAEIKKMS